MTTFKKLKLVLFILSFVFLTIHTITAKTTNTEQLQEIVDASLNYYKTLSPTTSIPAYNLVVISASDWLHVSNKTEWNFEAGYIEGNTIYVTDPVSTEQSNIFPDIESVTRYTVAKKMITMIVYNAVPKWFEYGYAAYEAHLSRPYNVIQEIYNAANGFPGMNSLTNFDPENDIEQRSLAFTLAEYCMLIQGDMRLRNHFDNNGILTQFNSSGIDNVWHLFLEKHYLKSENQIKILTTNSKFAIYGSVKNQADAADYLNDLSSLLSFYELEFQVDITRRVDILINPDRCTQLLVEGWECDLNEGGGGHGNGMAGCSLIPYSAYSSSIALLLHEFTHVYQFWLKSNYMPAWLSEGFAQRLSCIQTIPDPFVIWKADMKNKWTTVMQNLGRYPTMNELMDYNFVRSNNVDYYTLGALMVDYIVEKGGYLALREIVLSNGLDFSSMGYDSKEDFLADFYFYFDVRIMDKKTVTLNSPVQTTEISADATVINLNWVPLITGVPLNISYSVDEGNNWIPVVLNYNGNGYDWDKPSDLGDSFYLKFSAPSNLNITSVFGPFNVEPPGQVWDILASNEKFDIWGYPTEQADANAVLNELSQNYERVYNVFQVNINVPLQVRIYPNLTAFHEGIGWPDAPDWVVGIGGSQISIVAPSNPGPTSSFTGILNVAIHEMVHCFVRVLASGGDVPLWLNEGTANYLAKPGVSPDKNYIKNLIENNDGIPTLEELNSSAFADIGGYPLSQTIVEFIVADLGGENSLRLFIASNTNYSVVGFDSQDDFQAAWFSYINKMYLGGSNSEYNTTDQASICQGETYIFGSQILSASGEYTEVFKSVSGSDSTVVLTLVVYPVYNEADKAIICEGETYQFGTRNLIEPGEYTEVFESNTGCDSTVTLTLVVNPAYNTTEHYTISQDESYIFGSQILTTEGVYTEVFKTTTGCDSIVVLTLTVLPASKTISLKSPVGGEYFLPGDTTIITWDSNIDKIDILFSDNDGSSWSEIQTNISNDVKKLKWEIPNSISEKCLVKIIDSSDNTIFNSSQKNFEIGEENQLGGPYKNDEHTVLLIHGEGNLYNQSVLSEDAVATGGTVRFVDNGMDDLGKAIYVNNSSGTSYLTVPHSEYLSLNNDWTIELWFKATSYNDGFQYLMFKPFSDQDYLANYAIQLNGNWENKLWGYYNYSNTSYKGVNNDFVPELNVWYHVTFIRDVNNDEIRLIVRDENRNIIQEMSAKNISGYNPLINPNDLLIGFNFTGYIDEIRISDIVRDYSPIYNTEAEICEGETFQFGSQTVSIPGQYTEIFKAANGNDSTVVLTLHVSSIEKTLILSENGILTCNQGGEYLWYLNGEIIAGANTQTYTPVVSGGYQVVAINTNGCESPISDVVSVVVTGVNQSEIVNEVMIYPNPTNGKINIEGLRNDVSYQVQLFDISSSLLQIFKISSANTQIDLSAYPSGTYNLILNQNRKKLSFKIIKK